MDETVGAVLAAGAERVIVVTGENERARASLRERFRDDLRVAVLGHTDRMSDLLAAADVLVHATCGVTCLEAALRGCPTVISGFAVGHGVVITVLGAVVAPRTPRGDDMFMAMTERVCAALDDLETLSLYR